jgi:hypothetical protein
MAPEESGTERELPTAELECISAPCTGEFYKGLPR